MIAGPSMSMPGASCGAVEDRPHPLAKARGRSARSIAVARVERAGAEQRRDEPIGPLAASRDRLDDESPRRSARLPGIVKAEALPVSRFESRAHVAERRRKRLRARYRCPRYLRRTRRSIFESRHRRLARQSLLNSSSRASVKARDRARCVNAASSSASIVSCSISRVGRQGPCRKRKARRQADGSSRGACRAHRRRGRHAARPRRRNIAAYSR